MNWKKFNGGLDEIKKLIDIDLEMLSSEMRR